MRWRRLLFSIDAGIAVLWRGEVGVARLGESCDSGPGALVSLGELRILLGLGGVGGAGLADSLQGTTLVE